jgi:S1-C subfamily serine protease
VILAAALIGAGTSQLVWPAVRPANLTAPTVPTTTPGSPASPGTTLPFGAAGAAGVAAQVDPALVDINVVFDYQNATGAGTGIVLSSDGTVLTNNHVIDQATWIEVTDIGNSTTYNATVVGYDNTHDIAVLQLQGASGLASVRPAASPVTVGEPVVAIGNAGGLGGVPSSAGGTVTGLSRSLTAFDELTQTSEQLSDLIEVDAAVEPGDSGGPLVNTAAQVVGVDTAATQSFAFSAEPNQGYAIPLSQAMSIVRQVESGRGTPTVHVGPTAFIGVLLASQTSTVPVPTTGAGTAISGPQVAQVVIGGPAQLAGITSGDILTSLNGRSLSTGESLTHMLVPYRPGQQVRIGWVDSSGRAHLAKVTLASGPPA